MKTKYTPGPWRYTVEDIGDENIILVPWEIRAGTGTSCVRIVSHEGGLFSWDGKKIPYGEREANARLISAAPDLLAACERLYGLVSEGFHPQDCAVVAALDEARAAIAKATGEGAS